MKLLTTLLLLIVLAQNSFAGGFHFPDEEYAYAKLYYYNLEEIRTKPDFYIYSAESGWAKSLLDPNITSSNGLAENMEKLFLYGADGLIHGLSGCFIPRHGLVYFNDKDEPVASLSICFECEGVRMWTKSKGNIKAKSTGSVKRSESQINTLRNFVEKEGMIISDKLEDYNTLLTNVGATITMEYYQLDQEIVNVTYDSVLLWNRAHSFEKDINVEYAAGGDKYEFAELKLPNGTLIQFDGNGPSAKMVEARILDEEVVLPNGVHLGSSLDDVMNTLTIYDGPAYPELITIKDQESSISYHFTLGKVDRIEIECYFH
ncbi:MAG: hypothetical protein H6600_08135 [Flavobacteriales bacterium]|nr:hypothetical protein [Flavobacteriales bacterium]MCB9198412.1 hypothetical protein [Flavobacteriales bacterium]